MISNVIYHTDDLIYFHHIQMVVKPYNIIVTQARVHLARDHPIYELHTREDLLLFFVI